MAAVVIWLAGQNAKQAYLCYQVPPDPTPSEYAAVSYCPTHPPHPTSTSVLSAGSMRPVVPPAPYFAIDSKLTQASIYDQPKPQRPQDALTVPNFTTSDESFATEELVNAYRAGDAEAIAKLITPNSIFMNIDNQVTCFVSS